MGAAPATLLKSGRQHGAALLIMLLIMVLTFSTILLTSISGASLEAQRQQKTLAALAQAKQALIGWSVLQGDMDTQFCVGEGSSGECTSTPATCTGTCVQSKRPGTLPCPDKNYFGSATSGNASGSCSSTGGTSIGRLPWKTLGVEPLRDANGDLLWYAVSDNFRHRGLNAKAINSDTKGTLQLYAGNGSTLLTPEGEELAAIVFSPNAPLSGQDRLNAPDSSSNYLESAGGKNNAAATGPFIAGPVKDSEGNVIVNDLVIGLMAKDLIAAVEKRALNEGQKALASYASVNGKYPNPGKATCNAAIANVAAVSYCTADSSTCLGRLPESELAPYVAPWFSANGWGRTIIYAVNKNDVLDDSGANCSASLKADGLTKHYVLVTPGTPLSGQVRPPTTTSGADYLEDSQNVDAWGGTQEFVKPGSESNDQMRTPP